MRHILVVDDDRPYTTMLRFLLEGDGYAVTTIESAERALESLAQNEYHLILLDVVMPDMDGLDLCRRIRATSDVPIMFLSVRSDVADKVLGMRAGVTTTSPSRLTRMRCLPASGHCCGAQASLPRASRSSGGPT